MINNWQPADANMKRPLFIKRESTTQVRFTEMSNRTTSTQFYQQEPSNHESEFKKLGLFIY